MKKNKCVLLLLLCSLVKKHHIYALFRILKQFLVVFCSIFDAPFCYLVEWPIHAFKEK